MRIPERVRIGAQWYTVIQDKMQAERGHFGECSCRHLELCLDPSARPARQAQTLLHEVMEAINHEYNVGLDHHQIELLELAIYQVVVDNPEMFKEERSDAQPI